MVGESSRRSATAMLYVSPPTEPQHPLVDVASVVKRHPSPMSKTTPSDSLAWVQYPNPFGDNGGTGARVGGAGELISPMTYIAVKNHTSMTTNTTQRMIFWAELIPFGVQLWFPCSSTARTPLFLGALNDDQNQNGKYKPHVNKEAITLIAAPAQCVIGVVDQISAQVLPRFHTTGPVLRRLTWPLESTLPT
jgi:hypothetical protein